MRQLDAGVARRAVLTLLKIAQIGHPVLLERAAPITRPDDPELVRLLDDMIETMCDAGGIGLAAPQVHRPLRAIIVMPIASREADRASVDPLVLLNPELDLVGAADEVGIEGCLSIPGLRGIVPRHRCLRWHALDRHGQPCAGAAEGLTARILQHEVDHLDGILFPMRMTDLSRLSVPDHVAHLLHDVREEGAS